MNEKEERTGYRGIALEAIKKADCGVGDIIRLSKNGDFYEGILIPRSEYGDEEHLVIKLNSGYNIGVRITPNSKIKKVGKGIKPSFANPETPNQNPDLPKVAIMSTGGTIASRIDYRTGAVRAALTASDLYGVVPELADLARIQTQILYSLYSENITTKHWTEISKAVAKSLEKGTDGVVIAHGTDTMAYTAAALSFSLQNLPVPVVLVGAQRSADRPSSDSATNLIAAVKMAAYAPFAEVVIAMHETLSDNSIVINRGTKVRKCHTSRRNTFKPVNATPIARIQDEETTILATNYNPRDLKRKLVLKPEFNNKVALIKFYPSMDPEIIEWNVKKGVKGLILEGTGLGHVSKYCFSAIKQAVEQDVVVALASQCIWGRVNMNVYETGRDLLTLGVIPLEDMFPETALVKLMWVLGQTSDPKTAKKLLRQNISNEFSARTLPEEV